MTFEQATVEMHQGKKMTRPGLIPHIDHISIGLSGLIVTCSGRMNRWRPSKHDLQVKDWEEV